MTDSVVKMLRDASVPGYGYVSKGEKISLPAAQAEWVVNREYGRYLTPPPVQIMPEVFKAVETPVKLNIEPPKTIASLAPVEPPKAKFKKAKTKFLNKPE